MISVLPAESLTCMPWVVRPAATAFKASFFYFGKELFNRVRDDKDGEIVKENWDWQFRGAVRRLSMKGLLWCMWDVRSQIEVIQSFRHMFEHALEGKGEDSICVRMPWSCILRCFSNLVGSPDSEV